MFWHDISVSLMHGNRKDNSLHFGKERSEFVFSKKKLALKLHWWSGCHLSKIIKRKIKS